MEQQTIPGRPGTISRRTFLAFATSTAAATALAACATPRGYISATSQPVLDAEQARRGTGAVKQIALRAAPSQLDLAGTVVDTWSYGEIPAPVVRLSAGDTLRAALSNDLPADTSIHWHGLALRNDMDGVPELTQAPVASRAGFTYEFIAPDPGTYWFHPHVGVQLDRGLYGALIVEDPNEPLNYDEEWVVVLDDWLDGVETNPDAVLEQLSGGMAPMEGMDGMLMRDGSMLMGAESEALGGDAGDVFYPHYLVNGRPPEDPETFNARPGTRVRIRLINAGGDTAFRVALGGHALTITHTDGFPVDPVEVDSVLIGMGERYDVLVTLGDGVFPFVSAAEGKQAAGFALVRTGSGTAPAPVVELPELTGRLGTADRLAATESVLLPTRSVDRQIEFAMSGSMEKFDWALNGRRFDFSQPLEGALGISEGERVQLTFKNDTTMWHPMHLHGHTFQHPGGGPRKDTSIVLPGQTLSVEFDADNPGQWLTHCHNIYHAEAGMDGVVAYLA